MIFKIKNFLFTHIIHPLTPRWVKTRSLNLLMETMVGYYRGMYIRILAGNPWEGSEEEQKLKQAYFKLGLATPVIDIMQHWFEMPIEDVFEVLDTWDEEIRKDNNTEKNA